MYKTGLVFRYPKLLIPLNVLLAFFLLIFILILTRDILSLTYRRADKTFYSAHSRAQMLKKGLQEYAAILKSNPFGFPGGQLKELSVSKEGSVSHSDITLVGTVSGPPASSYAIFSDRTGKQDVFKIGESVFGGGRLKRVDKDRAIITESGKEIKIPVAEMLTIKEVNRSESASMASDLARSVGRGTFIVDQNKILHALETPNQLMTDARLQPNLINGRQEGFILRDVRNGGIYQNLGLQNGDVLLRINDYNISNPENALQAFTALRGMDRVQLDIMRDGAPMTMTYQIR